MINPDLTQEQHNVLFAKATEPPGSGSLLHNHQDGTYSCANCQTVLFDSETKYDSGSGWPSFDSARPGSVRLVTDTSLGMQRQEAVCATCGGHLGHVFDDGPRETTGQRYCINSLSLTFDPYDTAQKSTSRS